MEYTCLGTIVNSFGIKGEMKVKPVSDSPDNLLTINKLYLKKNNKYECINVINAKFHKRMVLLKVEGFNSIEDVETVKNCELFCDKNDLLPCEDGQYYHKDL